LKYLFSDFDIDLIKSKSALFTLLDMYNTFRLIRVNRKYSFNWNTLIIK